MLKMEDTNKVATGAADFILEGDDEPANMHDGGNDSLLDHSSFNAPAGWAPAASRAGWGGGVAGSAAWDAHALSQGSSVNIEKAFGAFNGVGNNTMLGGLAYSIPGGSSPSNMVWSGAMAMSMGHDVTNDWNSNHDDGLDAAQRASSLPQGWAAPPPDSFQPAGESSSYTGRPDSSRGDGMGGRGQRSRRQPRERDNAKGGGGGRSGRNRGGENANINDGPGSRTADDGAGTQGGVVRGGRGIAGGKQQSTDKHSGGKRSDHRERGVRGGQVQRQTDGLTYALDAMHGGRSGVPSSKPTLPYSPSEQSAVGDMAGGGEGGGGGKSVRGRPGREQRSSSKIPLVPAHIRQAAHNMARQRDGEAP